jgi:hypothetical protein
VTRTSKRVWLVASAVAVSLFVPLDAVAETEALDFVRKDAQYRGGEGFKWRAIATDRDDLRRIWNRFNQHGPLPVIHFKRNIAILAGSGGSSSCRLRLHGLSLNRERSRILARVYQASGGGDCTDDWIPRTFTVAVARHDLRPLRPRDVTVRVLRVADPDN